MQPILAGQRERAAEVQVDAMAAQPPTSQHAATDEGHRRDDRYPRRAAEAGSPCLIGCRGHPCTTSTERTLPRRPTAPAVQRVEPAVQSGDVHRITGHATTVG